MDAVARTFGDLPIYAVSARRESGAARRACELGAPVLYDDAAFPSGPLAGVAAGLAWAKYGGYALLATAPCDAPLLPADFVSRLSDQLYDRAAAFATTAKGEHPLCALWRVDLHERLVARLAEGEHPSVRGFLREIDAAPVYFENDRAFANANTANVLTELECDA